MRVTGSTLVTGVRTVSEPVYARILSTLVHTTMSHQLRAFQSRGTADCQKGPHYTMITYNVLAQKYIDAG